MARRARENASRLFPARVHAAVVAPAPLFLFALLSLGLPVHATAPQPQLQMQQPQLQQPQLQQQPQPQPRFRSDASIGHEVQCTQEEKLCFHFNRVLSSAEDKCLPLGTDCDVGHHKHLQGKVKLFINRTESNIYNRFKATCRKTYCEDASDRNKLCPVPYVSYEETKESCGELPIRNNMYADLECVCLECGLPDQVVQPEESGRCKVPDLWRSYRGPVTDVIRSHCSDEDLRCFKQGKVLHEGRCQKLLERGPCDEGKWLVLDEVHYVVKRQLKAVCAPRRCASPEEVWMAFTKRCHPRAEVVRRVCVDGTVLAEDAFGRGECAQEVLTHFGLPQQREGAMCMTREPRAADGRFLAVPECQLTANGECHE